MVIDSRASDEHESPSAEKSAEAAPQRTPPEASAARVFVGGPVDLTLGGVLALQRASGNLAVLRMLRPDASAGSSARLARCPHGSCRGTCTCTEDEDSHLERHGAGGGRFKQVGGGPELPDGPPGEAPVEIVEDVEGGDESEEEEASAEGGTVAGDERAKSQGAVAVSLALVSPGPLRDVVGGNLRSKASTSVRSGAAASHALPAQAYGLTMEESVEVTISAKKVGSTWVPVVKKLVGHYSQQVRLLPGQSEVTGPSGNTTKANFCEQVTGLDTLGNTAGNPWYMLQAVKDHEDVHAKHFGPGLKAAEPAITAAIEAVSVPHVAGMKKATAVTALRGDAAFTAAVQAARQTWFAEDSTLLANDHDPGGATDTAEHAVVDPMVQTICKHAKKKKWGACPVCP